MENDGHPGQELRLQVPGTNEKNCVNWDESMPNVIPNGYLPLLDPEQLESLIAELITLDEVLIPDPLAWFLGKHLPQL